MTENKKKFVSGYDFRLTVGSKTYDVKKGQDVSATGKDLEAIKAENERRAKLEKGS